MLTPVERYRGCLLGLAAGDALGAAIEFQSPGTFQPVEDITGGGNFNLKPGEWTDDTSLALCLAESLIECGFDPKDQMNRYLRWYRQGYLSTKGHCFDIGNTTRAALERFERTGNPFSGQRHENSAGNGSIMRLAPVPMLFANQPEEAVEKSGLSSTTTHSAPVCVNACRYMGGILTGIFNGASKDEVLSPMYSPIPGYWETQPINHSLAEVASGSFKRKQPPEIIGSGYVVKSLEAALWAFYNSSSFEEGCLKAANLGDDADTTAAVYGQIAGAYYGENSIPERWRKKLCWREKIEAYADKLYELSVSKYSSM